MLISSISQSTIRVRAPLSIRRTLGCPPGRDITKRICDACKYHWLRMEWVRMTRYSKCSSHAAAHLHGRAAWVQVVFFLCGLVDLCHFSFYRTLGTKNGRGASCRRFASGIVSRTSASEAPHANAASVPAPSSETKRTTRALRQRMQELLVAISQTKSKVRKSLVLDCRCRVRTLSGGEIVLRYCINISKVDKLDLLEHTRMYPSLVFADRVIGCEWRTQSSQLCCSIQVASNGNSNGIAVMHSTEAAV